jgi:hypothetical protein
MMRREKFAVANIYVSVKFRATLKPETRSRSYIFTHFHVPKKPKMSVPFALINVCFSPESGY